MLKIWHWGQEGALLIGAKEPRMSIAVRWAYALRRQVLMDLLLAADGAAFSGLVEKIDGHARASYCVILDLGGDRKVENDSKVFSGEREATAWIDREANMRGFKSYSLSLKYPPNGVHG